MLCEPPLSKAPQAKYVCNCLVVYSMKKRISAKQEPNASKPNEMQCDMPIKPPHPACGDCMTGVISCVRHMGMCGKAAWVACSRCSRWRCGDAKCLTKVCCREPAKSDGDSDVKTDASGSSNGLSLSYQPVPTPAQSANADLNVPVLPKNAR